MFESFTNDFFQNTDLDYNVLNENVYSNMLTQTFKTKREKSDPVLTPLPKSTMEKYLEGSEPIVPIKLEQQKSHQHFSNPLNIEHNFFSNEMIAIISMIVLILYIYVMITKKIDKLIRNQAILNNNIIKYSNESVLDSDGVTVLPKMT